MTKIIRRSVLAALALVGAAALVPQAAQAGNRDFTLANRLAVTTLSVFVRPTGGQGWSQDLLGSDVLPGGRQTLLRLGNGEQCVFDVKVALVGGAEGVFSRINLCALDSMSVYFDGALKADLRNVQ